MLNIQSTYLMRHDAERGTEQYVLPRLRACLPTLSSAFSPPKLARPHTNMAVGERSLPLDCAPPGLGHDELPAEVPEVHRLGQLLRIHPHTLSLSHILVLSLSQLPTYNCYADANTNHSHLLAEL